MTSKIGFIGGGNMARSIIGGLINQGTSPDSITVSDTDKDQCLRLQDSFRINIADNNVDLAGSNDILVLAVKPNIMQSVCSSIGTAIPADTVVVSIAAGVTEASIAGWLGKQHPVVRCMPNTPALLNCGASALHANNDCNEHQKQSAQQVLDAAGITVWVDKEEQLDAVTALSGSGPAYFFYLIECMTQSAKALGLTGEIAEKLAIETAYGAAMMARQGQETPAKLRENVTSKGGTTAAALVSMNNNEFPVLIKEAMEAARDRAAELGRELGDN